MLVLIIFFNLINDYYLYNLSLWIFIFNSEWWENIIKIKVGCILLFCN
ncbi:hypothetical protein XBFM1_1910112 [Xenorhabdus bovienii str. feltiae Moldova]|uniref:Uncharacterized protein n=2 Tax=Xenorhabdus bovienii TaxID=40576 RepID=A0A0B6XDZ5_XENBV|nr:hypothetical protein XBFM1_1910112 [Xenorhabdus bovienii str. feltiae Moldova]CDM92082.1 protein of unknown function [Xenorhabdus bovienii]